MKERELHELIEQQDPEHKQELLEKIKLRIATEVVPEQAESVPAPAPRRKNNFTIIFASILTACLLCLAIVLPVTLTRQTERYCAAGDYNEEVLTYNVKEYATRTNKKILYLNWYDTSDVVTTLNYNVKNHEDMIFISEILVNMETGETISLSITDNKTMVDVLDAWKSCKTETIVNSVKVKTDVSLQAALATFEYNGYRYYIQIDNAADSSRITQVVEQMLETK